VTKVRELLEAIENKEFLKVIKADASGITVKIGQENEVKAMHDCTVITVPYLSKEGAKGLISILGPTRMEYEKVIPLLEYIAENMKNIV
jgi:heat-inducible transcriptional repressor